MLKLRIYAHFHLFIGTDPQVLSRELPGRGWVTNDLATLLADRRSWKSGNLESTRQQMRDELPAWRDTYRTLLSFREVVPEAALVVSELGWIALSCSALGKDASAELESSTRSAEAGRPSSWASHYMRGLISGGRGDEAEASEHFARCFQAMDGDGEIPPSFGADPQEQRHWVGAISNIIHDLDLCSPAYRLGMFKTAVRAALTIARKFPEGTFRSDRVTPVLAIAEERPRPAPPRDRPPTPPLERRGDKR